MPEEIIDTEEQIKEETIIEVQTDNSDLIDFFINKEESDKELQDLEERQNEETEELKREEEEEHYRQQVQYETQVNDDILGYLESINMHSNNMYKELLELKEENIKIYKALEYSNNQSYFFIVAIGVILFLTFMSRLINKFI